jgi:hypothetical protein
MDIELGEMFVCIKFRKTGNRVPRVPLASPVQPPGFRLLILGFHT